MADSDGTASDADGDPRLWAVRALVYVLAAVGACAALGLVAMCAVVLGPYLARPLVMRYGETTSAYYVESGIRSGRRGVTHWAVLRYGDVSGPTREFDDVVDVPELHRIEAGKVVTIHYLPGWPSTAFVDGDFDPIQYAIAWITLAVMAGIGFFRWRRRRTEGA